SEEISRILSYSWFLISNIYVKISIPSLFVIIHTYQVRGYSSRPNNCTLSLPSISLHWLCFTWSTIKIKGCSSIYSIIHYFIPSSRTLPIIHYHLQSSIIIEIYYYNIRFSSFYYKNPL
ncbi:hypothetical protein BCR42DRAFT_401098, partial [Absidia repens]